MSTTPSPEPDIYLVGGAVRDQLLNLEVRDRDWVVVGATPQQMLALGYRQVGADFPVFLHPHTGEEYALARTERKQGQGYHGFAVHSAPDVTLEDDLRRRDLTINAMARAGNGDIVDPFAGRQDLQRKKLRNVSGAFAEDPLRILRAARFAARFAALGFTVADDTMTLMRNMVAAGEMRYLAAERVWQECQRALMEKTPAVFLDVLRDAGALAELIPEFHDNQCFDQARRSLACAAEHDLPLPQRFAVLLAPLQQQAEPRGQALKAPNDCQQMLALVSRTGNLAVTANSAAKQLAVMEQADAWRRPERFRGFLDACRCLPQPLAVSQHQRLLRAFDSAAGVQAKTLMARGIRGKALGQAIRDERLQRMQQLN